MSFIDKTNIVIKKNNNDLYYFDIDKDIVLDSPDLVKLINSSSHEIELKSSDYNIDGIRKASRELSNITNKDMKFCYSEKELDDWKTSHTGSYDLLRAKG